MTCHQLTDEACEPVMKPKFYDCGCCGAMHSNEFHGDCRDDSARFFPEDLDKFYGPFGWEEVPMCPEIDENAEGDR